MKKFILLFIICFSAALYSEAQNKKLFVSKQGGKPRLLNGFKLSYDRIYFTNNSDKCDTLLADGYGFERCRMEKSYFSGHASETKYYELFNFAIRQAEKHIRRTKAEAGVLTLAHAGSAISVKFTNADSKGNAVMEIEVL